MHIDTANQIMNDQDEVIADLRHKLLEMTDARDLAVGQSLELVRALKRVICAVRGNEDDKACSIAVKAIDDFQGK